MRSVEALLPQVLHDLRNNLAIVLNYAELISIGVDPTDEKASDAREIVAAVERSVDLFEVIEVAMTKQQAQR